MSTRSSGPGTPRSRSGAQAEASLPPGADPPLASRSRVRSGRGRREQRQPGQCAPVHGLAHPVVPLVPHAARPVGSVGTTVASRTPGPAGGRAGLPPPRPQGVSISTEPRINDRIRVPEVRLVGPNGEQVGIVRIEDALRLAQEADLDLVEVAPMARPPVAKLMDFGKFKYESAMKERESRRNQAHTVIKEMKLRPKIDPHDYDTKKGHVVRFLNAGDKVKITIMFRGREQSRPELGYRLLQRLAEDVQELGFVESSPKQDGRNMIMVLGPHKKKTEAMAEAREAKARRAQGAAGSDVDLDADLPDGLDDGLDDGALAAPSEQPAAATAGAGEPTQ
nr:translation initiation factor IF-3 [Motilibacter rhizosphaerae]